MGISPFGRSYALPMTSVKPVEPPNPDPRNFTITKVEVIGANIVASIKYPGCTTYEGEKILVFKNIDARKLANCLFIDPHFSEAGTFSPIARFKPTKEGWMLARICAAAAVGHE